MSGEQWSDEETAEYKRRFARGIILGLQPYEAICRAIPDESVDRVNYARAWQVDETVLAFKREIEEDEGDDALGLQTRAEFCRQTERMLGQCEELRDPETFAKVAKVYADVRGWNRKPVSTSTTEVTNVTQHVMLQSHFGSDDQWEIEAQRQQRALQTDGQAITDAQH